MSQTQSAAVTDVTQKKNSKMNIVLWGLQVILALLFSMAGYQKTFLPIDVIAPTIFWVVDVPESLVRFIGISELLGALGLVLPGSTGIRPRLTIVAAGGIGAIMVGALIFHIIRGELFVLPMIGAFLAVAAFIVYGRLKLAPYSAKR